MAESTTFANIFNDYFHSFSLAVQTKHRFPYKSSKDYLPFKKYESFFITPKSKAEIVTIIPP